MTVYKVSKYFLEKGYFNVNRFLYTRLLGVFREMDTLELFLPTNYSISSGGRLRGTEIEKKKNVGAVEIRQIIRRMQKVVKFRSDASWKIWGSFLIRSGVLAITLWIGRI